MNTPGERPWGVGLLFPGNDIPGAKSPEALVLYFWGLFSAFNLFLHPDDYARTSLLTEPTTSGLNSIYEKAF